MVSRYRSTCDASTSRSGQSTTGWPTACAPTCFCACSHITWNGTCASVWPPCSTTTPKRMRPKRCAPVLSPRPSAPLAPSPNRPPVEPRTASQCTASAPCLPTRHPYPKHPGHRPRPPAHLDAHRPADPPPTEGPGSPRPRPHPVETLLSKRLSSEINSLRVLLQGQWDPTFSEHSYGFRPGRFIIARCKPKPNLRSRVHHLVFVRQLPCVASGRAAPSDAAY